MKKYMRFIIDVFNNLLAFGVYIIAMQIIFLPYMSRYLSVNTNAKLLTYVIIMNIATNTFGNELGVLYQLLMGREAEKYKFGEFRWLNLFSMMLVFVGSFITFMVLKYSWLEVIVLAFIVVLANNRLYYQAIFRSEKTFKRVAVSNVAYLAGILLGIVYCHQAQVVFWLPILLADLFANISFYLMKRETVFDKPVRGEDFGYLVKEYSELGFSSMLMNIPAQVDKLITLPLLGAANMGVYYAGTALSRVFFLAVNPINGVLLPWLVSSDIKDKKKVIRKFVQVNIAVLLGIFLIGLPFNYITSYILYPHLLDDIMTIVVPLSLTAAFSVAASLLRIVYLNFFELQNIKYISILNIVFFLISVFIGGKYFGLVGFAAGNAFSKFTYWALYLYYINHSEMRDLSSPSTSES